MKKIILLFCIFFNCFAINLDEIKNTMQTNIDKSLVLLKNKNKNIDEVALKIFQIFDPIFDYKLMAKLSLSKSFNKLNEKEKEMYIKIFEENLKRSFINKLKLYKDEVLKIQNGELKNKNRYFLNSSMVINGEEKNIIFKFYSENNNWLIYDVDILGVSLIQTYRSQFADILEKQGFNALIEKLKTTNNDI